MDTKKYVQLKNSDINNLRETLLIEQNNKCLICGEDISLKSHLDHKHKTSKEQIGENGAGLVRGLLCPSCNNYLGKVENNHKRFKYGTDIIFILENIIKYLKREPLPFIHPNEKPKEPKLSKRNFNQLKKLYFLDTNKELKYPKSGKMVKKLEILYKKYNIEPFNL